LIRPPALTHTAVWTTLLLSLGCGNGQVGGGAAGASGHAAGAGANGTGPGAAGDTAGAAGTGPGAAGDVGGLAGAGPGAAGAGSGAAGTGAAGTSATGAAGTAATGGTGGKTPPPDAGVGDGPAAGGDAAAMSCAGRLVCDDFEQAVPGLKLTAPWTIHVSKGTGTVAVDETRAFSGKRSVKVSIAATTATDTSRQAMLAVTGVPLIPLPNNHVYGRFMIYTERIPDKTVHWTIAHGDGPVATLSGTYNYGGMGGLMANYYRNTTPATDCWQTKPTAFPTGRWTCVGFEFDGGANEMRFSLDGVDVPELHVTGLSKSDATCTVKGVDGRWLAPTFKNISVGWESYQHDVVGAHDAWIDDVVLDDQPVACP
jgi:hypothetical protein